jgi:hypothetical protein
MRRHLTNSIDCGVCDSKTAAESQRPGAHLAAEPHITKSIWIRMASDLLYLSKLNLHALTMLDALLTIAGYSS